MTRDEIQKLIGGYATGSLTESERKLLFDAALEDQELFDQLAHEQALKELLEEPGVKQRLITALSPEKQPSAILSWNRWPWAIGLAAACLAVVIGVELRKPIDKPREIAAVIPRSEPTPPVVVTPVSPKSTPSPAPPKEKRAYAEPAVAENVPPRAFTPAPPRAFAPGPPPPVPEEPPKLKKAEEPAAVAPPMIALAPPPSQISGFRADETTQQQAGQVRIAGGVASPAGGRGGGKGGGKGGGGNASPSFAAQRAAAPAPARFAFDYSFDAAGALRILPTAPGYLSVTAGPTVLYPSRTVVPGTPVIIPIAADASEVVVSFSASPGVTGAPAKRGEAAGTVEDQSPPNQRILVTIPVKR